MRMHPVVSMTVFLEHDMRPKILEEMKAFVQAAGTVPFIVKGVLSVKDAVKCVQAGVRGIVVSHHHGIMDYSIPPADGTSGNCQGCGRTDSGIRGLLYRERYGCV